MSYKKFELSPAQREDIREGLSMLKGLQWPRLTESSYDEVMKYIKELEKN